MDVFTNDQPFEFGEAVYRDGGQYGPVRQEHLDLSYLYYGEVTMITDDRTHTFTAGKIIFIYNERKLEVSFPRGQESKVIWCHTGEIAVPHAIKASIKSLPVSLPKTDLLLMLLEEGTKLGPGHGVSLSRVRNSLGAALYNEYVHQSQLDEEERILPSSVLRAKRFIEKNFSGPCGLEKIASVSGLTPRHLHHLFKTHLDITPNRYLWQRRAEKGIHLLQQSGLTISEIAYRCGFQTSNHFSRYIREHYDLTPTQLRDHKWLRDPCQFNQNVQDIR